MGLSFKSGGTWLRNVHAISQEWSIVSRNTAHLFPLCSSTEPTLPSPCICCSRWRFMTRKFKGPFLLPQDKLYKGRSAWMYGDFPQLLKYEKCQVPMMLIRQYSDYSSWRALHTQRKANSMYPSPLKIIQSCPTLLDGREPWYPSRPCSNVTSSVMPSRVLLGRINLTFYGSSVFLPP